jgi:3-oxoacyl-[acyl-carrier protein] reductase
VTAVRAELGDPPHLEVDLADPGAPADLVRRARAEIGPLTTLVAAHARSASGNLAAVTAHEMDACFAVNARASVLLAQAFASQYQPAAGPGRVVLFTSGQHRGPMQTEIAYALSKGAVQQITATLAAELTPGGIAVVCINPGPTDTGWANPQTHAELEDAFPSGRWTTPDEIAQVVEWLTGPAGLLMTGTTLDAEAGFRRSL